VQVAGFGMRMKASLLKTEFQRGGSLQSLLLGYTQALYALVSQAAACNGIHRLEERFARWLVLMCERVDSKELLLTHESISKLLGVRRAGVTEAANSLQRAGIIRYSRGKITILNRQKLEAASCPCYKIIKGEYARLLGTEDS
jgi:CRP-like cAMP-binding protein